MTPERFAELRRRAEEWKNDYYGEELAAYLSEALEEIKQLQDWKESAMRVLLDWDEVFVALGRPGPLGSSKAVASKAEVQRLRAEVTTLEQRRLHAQTQYQQGRSDERADTTAFMTGTARVFRDQGDAIEWKTIKDERDRLLRGEHKGAAG